MWLSATCTYIHISQASRHCTCRRKELYMGRHITPNSAKERLGCTPGVVSARRCTCWPTAYNGGAACAGEAGGINCAASSINYENYGCKNNDIMMERGSSSFARTLLNFLFAFLASLATLAAALAFLILIRSAYDSFRTLTDAGWR